MATSSSAGRETLRDLTLHAGPRQVRVLVERQGTRLEVLVAPRTGPEIEPVRFEIDARANYWCPLAREGSRGYASPRWSMVRGLPPVRHASGDFFVRITQLVHELLYPRQREGRRPSRSEIRRRRALASEVMARVYGVVREAAIAAADTLDPDLRGEVLRFPPVMRWWLYQQLQRDESGRLRQLLHVAPGLASFAFACSESRHSIGLSRSLQRLVVRGVRLPRVIEMVVEGWSECINDLGAWGCDGPAVFAVVHRGLQGELPARERAKVLRNMGVLLRCAGPRVAPSFVLLPPPIELVREDIPRGTYANARWYGVMHSSQRLMGLATAVERPSLAGLAKFLSAHALELGKGKAPWVARSRASSLAEYVADTRRVPGRKSSLPRLIKRHARWLVERQDRWGWPESFRVLAANPDAPLPEPFVPGWEHGDVQVKPLDTFGALDAEAKHMNHCVRSRVGAVGLGVSSLYAASVGDTRITIEIERSCDGPLRLAQMSGVRNRQVSRRSWTKLKPWFRANEILVNPHQIPEPPKAAASEER